LRSIRRGPGSRVAPIRRRLVWLGLVGFALSSQVADRAWADDRPGTSSPRPSWDDPAVQPEERARRALDAANALDQDAQRSKTVIESRSRWLEASKLLDDFLARNGSVSIAPSLRFQSAVYLWARSRALLDQVDLLVATNPDRLDVIRGFDDSISRLRAISTPPKAASDPFAQNVRFRLAQAIADRARLRPEADPDRTASEKEAQALLDRSINSPRLRAFARLLHAELSNRLGQYGPAQIEVEEAARLDPPPPLVTLTEAKVDALAGRGQFSEAERLADGAAAPFEQKALWKLRVALARRKFAEIGRDRTSVDAEVFRAAGSISDPSHPESRRGLMELARAIDEPPPNSPPEWWDLLAEGHLRLLEPERAAKLALRGADRAEATGDVEAATQLRFKAGACWFQGEKFAEADAILSRIADDSKAPRPLRAKAGMLRAIGRGRALVGHEPRGSKSAYIAALEAQIRDFADDPASGEARWLLGKLRLASNRRDEAVALWSGIAHGQARWLDAQLNSADQAMLAIEDQWINRDAASARPRVEAARKMIRSALDQAAEGDESVALGLRLARLESIPGIGQPAEAVATFDRLLRGPASPDQHRQARLGRMVALAEQNRFADAESVARNEAKGDDLAGLLPSIRALDRLAGETDGDLVRKRTGALIRVLLDRWADPIDRSPPEDRDEVRLRQARALLFSGDPVGARRAIARWGGPTGKFDDPEVIRDLGDTYVRLEAYALAVDVERLRASKVVAGSLAWFDARYCLALALYRSDRVKEARKVIDATTILHPDLGGGEIRARFERLGQKLRAE